jgi:hypothetical protein
MFHLTCNWCERVFQTKCLLDNFCSEECSNNYWKNPASVDVTSTCPQCSKQHTRTVLSVACRGWLGLVLCPTCSEPDNEAIIS